MLHQPEIPYNTGSVGRTCVAAEAKLWLVRPLGFRVDDYYLRRAGLDYWERLAWEVVDDWTALTAALPPSAAGCSPSRPNARFGTPTISPATCWSSAASRPACPTRSRREHADSQLRIPTSADVRSLNLSNSVAVAVYEALRQWQTGARRG